MMKQVKRIGVLLIALSTLGVCFAGVGGYTGANGNVTAPSGTAK